MAAEKTPELITSAQAVVRFWTELLIAHDETQTAPMPDVVLAAVMGAVAEAAVEDGLCLEAIPADAGPESTP